MEKKPRSDSAMISTLFLVARMIMILSIPLEGLKSYGDFWNFYNLAALGRPFFDLWLEFPPFFPFLSRGIYLLVGGREHSYIYALIVLLSIVQAANIYIFHLITELYFREKEVLKRSLVYAVFTLGLFYSWAYFDAIAVFSLLLGLWLIIRKKNKAAGLVLGIGGTIKWFPLLLLPAAWKWLERKKAIILVLIAVLLAAIVWGLLFGLSPDLTKASFISQGMKGSWETIWAVLDGNLGTGNFGPQIDRRIAEHASLQSANPAAVPVWVTLILFGGIGYLVFLRSDLRRMEELVAFSGLTLVLFFLWSPGYSPQWVLYLLPLVLLSFNSQRSILFSVVLLLINILEWPILLSRGWFQYLDEIVWVRTGLFVVLAILFSQVVLTKKKGEVGLGSRAED